MEQQKLSFCSKPENISLVEQFIEKVCDEYKLLDDYYGNILIAITEAVNNAIYHGNKANPEKTVKIAFESRDGMLTFVISDEGTGFDYDNLPDPTDPANLEKPSGRGVFLMKNLADKVDFREKGKTIALDFKVSAN